MASIQKKSRSPYYIAYYTLRDGRRTSRSTKQTDRKRAQRLADEWEDAERAAVLTLTACRRAIGDAYQRANGEQLPAATVRGFAKEWLLRKADTIGEKSEVKYQGVVDAFLKHLGPQADADIMLLRKSHISNYLRAVAKQKSVRSANGHIKILRAMLNDARRDELIDTNPAELVRPLKSKRGTPKVERRPFSMDQIKEILRVAPPDIRALTLLGLYTGQRMGDLCRLKWSAVDFEMGEIRFTTSKTGRHQKIPLAPALENLLRGLEAGDDPEAFVLPELAERIERSNSSAVSRRFRSSLVAAGIVAPRSHRKSKDGKGRDGQRKLSPYSFHCLRHTLTTMLKSAGVSSPVAQEIIGHESEAMSRVYTHLGDSELREAMNRLPKL